MLLKFTSFTAFSVIFLSCGTDHPDKSRLGKTRLTPEEANEESKREISSCIDCGGAGFSVEQSKCKKGETCYGTTLMIENAPITLASCQRFFKDVNGKEYSFAMPRDQIRVMIN